MIQIEVLVEEPSAEEALRHLLPKMLKARARFKVINLRSKHRLLAALESRLRGYKKRIENGENLRVIVLVDRDDDDCMALKKQLELKAVNAGLHTKSRPDRQSRFNLVNRIVVEELECWFLGDPTALRKAFTSLPKINAARSVFRSPDRGSWETLHRFLKKNKVYRRSYPKIDAARRIAPHMNVEQNRSPSFRQFRAGVEAILK